MAELLDHLLVVAAVLTVQMDYQDFALLQMAVIMVEEQDIMRVLALILAVNQQSE